MSHCSYDSACFFHCPLCLGALFSFKHMAGAHHGSPWTHDAYLPLQWVGFPWMEDHPGMAFQGEEAAAAKHGDRKSGGCIWGLAGVQGAPGMCRGAEGGPKPQARNLPLACWTSGSVGTGSPPLEPPSTIIPLIHPPSSPWGGLCYSFH